MADSFDAAKGVYVGLKVGRLVEIDFGSDAVLVRREVADTQLAKAAAVSVPSAGGSAGPDVVGQPAMVSQPPVGGTVQTRKRPRRFYAKVTLDPHRPTPQISSIAQSILSELDRARGTKVTLTLDIDAETADGFPEDVEEIVRDNAGSLKITDFGFEGE